jgi:hypothetical protein
MVYDWHMTRHTYFVRTWDVPPGVIPEWVEHEYDDAAPAVKEIMDDIERRRKDHVVFLDRYLRDDPSCPVVLFPTYRDKDG